MVLPVYEGGGEEKGEELRREGLPVGAEQKRGRQARMSHACAKRLHATPSLIRSRRALISMASAIMLMTAAASAVLPTHLITGLFAESSTR